VYEIHHSPYILKPIICALCREALPNSVYKAEFKLSVDEAWSTRYSLVDQCLLYDTTLAIVYHVSYFGIVAIPADLKNSDSFSEFSLATPAICVFESTYML